VRRLSLALLSVLFALPLQRGGAQIIRGGQLALRDPQTWISAGVGWQSGWTVSDGTTASRWELGDSQQYGLSIERTVKSGITLGVRAATSQPSMDFASVTAGELIRQADIRVSQALGVIHVTTGRDIRSVFELGVGSTIYSGFRERRTDARLGPSTDADFTFVFSYGLGYSFSRSFHIDVVQDLGTSLHQKTGLAAGDDTSMRISSTRVIARLGLGG
jgi:hypothetical protein